MKIDRFMVNLFFEIKRNLPIAKQSNFKLSNPHLGEQMIETFNSIDDEANQRLIEVFLERAGADWVGKLKLAGDGSTEESHAIAIEQSLNTTLQSSTKKQRYYRGVPI